MKPNAFILLAALFPALLTSCASHCGCKADLKDVSASDFTPLRFAAPSGNEYPVLRTKPAHGRPILVLHELNGLNSAVLDFCLKDLQKDGWTAYAPVLWDEQPGDQGTLCATRRLVHGGPQWRVQDRHSSGQVLDDMAAMTRWISSRHNGQRVVVMGNCLTGSFPLALLAEKTVCAGVLCQPALPIANPSYLALIGGCQSRETKRSLGIPPDRLEAAYRALDADRSKRLLGFHYLQDWIAPMEKFERIHEDMASRGMEDRFRPVVLVPRDSQKNASWWRREVTDVQRSLNGKPHNTVTASGSLEDRKRMRERMLELLRGVR